MSDFTEFYFSSDSDIVQYELIEISHSNFSQTYYIVRNNPNGVTVTLENDIEQDFEYYPIKLTPLGQKEDLDFGIKVEFGDLGEVLPIEIDLVNAANGFDEKPALIYRSYRSDNLVAPLEDPLHLEVSGLDFSDSSVTLDAQAPRVNMNRTGEFYRIDRFPMLAAFL